MAPNTWLSDETNFMAQAGESASALNKLGTNAKD